MTNLVVERLYEKRATEKSAWSGRIGSVRLEVGIDTTGDEPKCVWSLDGNILPASSVEHLMNFSLQSLQDAYAGAESLSDAIGRWAEKRDRIVNGTLGTRSGTAGEEAHMRFVRDIIRANLSPESKAVYAAMKGDSEGRTEYLNAKFAALDSAYQNKFVEAAKEMLAEEIRKRNEARAIAADAAGGMSL